MSAKNQFPFRKSTPRRRINPCIVLDRGQDLTSYNPGDDLVAGGFQFFADWSIQSQGWRGEMLCRAENNAGRK